MQLKHVFCCTIITITVTAICAHSDRRYLSSDTKKVDRRLRRRETTVLLDNYNMDRQYDNPKMIYRRLSKHRFVHQKSPFSIRGKPRYPYKNTRKPNKRSKIPGKYGSSKYNKHQKKRVPSKFPPTNRFTLAAGRPPKKNHKPRVPYSFGEPPIVRDEPEQYKSVESNHQIKDYQLSNIKPGYGEPPVDSYGAPITPNLHDLTSFDTIQSIAVIPTNVAPFQTFKLRDLYRYDNWKNNHQDEQTYIVPANENNYERPSPHDEYKTEKDNDEELFVTPIPVPREEHSFNSYSDIYNYKQNEKYKKKSQYLKPLKFPVKPKDVKDGNIIVGGQYAEPPVRFVPRSTPRTLDYDDEFVPLDAADPDIVSSANKSPYVNYKNSNMAFSPQNLNDAFSIVD